MTDTYLLLGSNIGHRLTNLRLAVQQIQKRVGFVVKQSTVYETEAWGLKEQSSFLNMAVMLQTNLPADRLLTQLKAIEQEIGRKETVKWGPRLIDIDILLYGEQVIQSADLNIPHPHLHERRFTLVPLSEIASDLMHPVLNSSIRTLLENCSDPSEVKLSEQKER